MSNKAALVSSTPKSKERRSSSVSSLDLDSSDHFPGTFPNSNRQPQKVKKSPDAVRTEQTTLDLSICKTGDNTRIDLDEVRSNRR